MARCYKGTAKFKRINAEYAKENPGQVAPEESSERIQTGEANSPEEFRTEFESQVKNNEPDLVEGTLEIHVNGPFETHQEALNS